MYYKVLTLLFLFTGMYSDIFSQVRINEFMQSNIDCIMDDLNDFPDSWVELYNDGDNPVNLNGWYLGLKKDYNKCWKIIGNYTIPSKGFLLIFCDKVGSGLHTDFRLETTKSSDIYLFDSNGVRVDYVTNIPAQPNPNISRGLDSDGNWKYFVEATPGKANTTSTAQTITPDPVFSISAGIYRTSLDIEIINNSGIQDSQIYYTINGSEPTKNSIKYVKPISIDTTTVIKAKIIADNYLVPWSVTNTYIITDRDFSLPIISLSLNNEYLWDDMIGIYTTGTNGIPTNCRTKNELANYRLNWRRPVNIEYFPDNDSGSVLNQLGETRIMGKCSRENEYKSLAVYSNKRFGKKHFDYPVFQNENKKDILLKSFLLRNSGQDYSYTFFLDGLVQSLMAGKVDLEYQAYQPVTLFVNGHYWGIINLRERSNEDHVYGNYDGLENIDMIEDWNDLKVGDKNEFNYLMTRLNAGNLSYEELNNLVDIDEFINLNILQIFIGNGDFPFNNFIMWKEKSLNTKWRFILKDTDWAFQSAEDSYYYNTLSYYLNGLSTSKSTLLLRNLMSHPDFKERFLNHFTVYMGDFLNQESIHFAFDSIKSNIAEEMVFHLQRPHAPYRVNYWENYILEMKDWVSNRYEHQYKHLNDYYGLKGIVPFTINKIEDATRKSIVEMNDIGLQTNRFNGMYYKGEKFKLKWTEGPDLFVSWNIKFNYEAKPSTAFVFEDIEMEYTLPEDIESVEIEIIHSLKNTEFIGSDDEEPVVISRHVNGISIYGLQEKSEIRLLDISGKQIKQFIAPGNHISVDLYEKGIYILNISTGKKTQSYKVIY